MGKIENNCIDFSKPSCKAQVGLNMGGGLENIIDNIDKTEGDADAGVLVKEAGSYRTRSTAGYVARASTAEASASYNIFNASANAPAVSAGVHTGAGTWAAAHANAELCKAQATAGPVTVGVGLNANTEYSVGVDGIQASVLGFGVNIGPRFGIRTPVADLSCSIM